MKLIIKWPPWAKENEMPIDDVGPLMTAQEYFEIQLNQVLGIMNKDRSRRVATYNLWFVGAEKSWRTDGYKKINPPTVPIVGADLVVDTLNLRFNYIENDAPLCDERPLPWDVEPEPRPTQQVGEWNADGWYLAAYRSNPKAGEIVQYEGMTLKFVQPNPFCRGWFTEAALAENFPGKQW